MIFRKNRKIVKKNAKIVNFFVNFWPPGEIFTVLLDGLSSWRPVLLDGLNLSHLGQFFFRRGKFFKLNCGRCTPAIVSNSFAYDQGKKVLVFAPDFDV